MLQHQGPTGERTTLLERANNAARRWVIPRGIHRELHLTRTSTNFRGEPGPYAEGRPQRGEGGLYLRLNPMDKKEEILKKIDELRMQWTIAKVSDRPLIERRGRLLKKQLEYLEKNKSNPTTGRKKYEKTNIL